MAAYDGPAPAWIPAAHKMDQTDAGCGGLTIARANEKSIGALMGKAFRNPVTGEVQIRSFGIFEDFCVADLWTRRVVQGSVEQLTKDSYLFRPTPMSMRTWLYHHYHRTGKVLPDATGSDEDAMIKYVLQQHCVDAPNATTGKWAPIVLHVPMILFLTIAGDLSAVVGCIAALALILAIQFIMNTPELYRWHRPVTFPIRFVLAIYLILCMGAATAKETSDWKTSFGFLITLLLCFAEIGLGDGSGLFGYRLHCSYEVIRTLPNRIYVCRRHGAAFGQDVIGRSLPVCEKITGMGYWQEDYVLIADVKGLIVELRPMGRSDWEMIFQEKQLHEEIIHRYVGLDVYSPGAATIDSLIAAIQEKEKIAAMNAEKRHQLALGKDIHVEDVH